MVCLSISFGFAIGDCSETGLEAEGTLRGCIFASGGRAPYPRAGGKEQQV